MLIAREDITLWRAYNLNELNKIKRMYLKLGEKS